MLLSMLPILYVRAPNHVPRLLCSILFHVLHPRSSLFVSPSFSFQFTNFLFLVVDGRWWYWRCNSPCCWSGAKERVRNTEWRQKGRNKNNTYAFLVLIFTFLLICFLENSVNILMFLFFFIFQGGYNLPAKFVLHTVGPIGENEGKK